MLQFVTNVNRLPNLNETLLIPCKEKVVKMFYALLTRVQQCMEVALWCAWRAGDTGPIRPPAGGCVTDTGEPNSDNACCFIGPFNEM
jgi:hypothetical protein